MRLCEDVVADVLSRQFLVDNKYAAPGKVAINGGSNGGAFMLCRRPTLMMLIGRETGLLVAACVNRAPEGLLGAAVADVGVLDLLKASVCFSSANYIV